MLGKSYEHRVWYFVTFIIVALICYAYYSNQEFELKNAADSITAITRQETGENIRIADVDTAPASDYTIAESVGTEFSLDHDGDGKIVREPENDKEGLTITSLPYDLKKLEFVGTESIEDGNVIVQNIQVEEVFEVEDDEISTQIQTPEKGVTYVWFEETETTVLQPPINDSIAEKEILENTTPAAFENGSHVTKKELDDTEEPTQILKLLEALTKIYKLEDEKRQQKQSPSNLHSNSSSTDH